MDTFELNKIAGAILGSLLFIMGIGFLAELLYAPPHLEQQAYVVELPEEAAEHGGAGGMETEAEAEPLAVVLATGTVDAGAKQIRKCAACHTFEAGGAKKIGPNLHDIVGRAIATREGFAYSDAMKAKAGETWTYENLFVFLEAPDKWVPKTIMKFAGLKKPGDRADVIAYLRSVSPDAPPLPEAETTSGAAESEPEAPQSAAAEPAAPAEASEPEPAPADAAASEPAVAPEPEAAPSAEMVPQAAEAPVESPAPTATPEPVSPGPAPAPTGGVN